MKRKKRNVPKEVNVKNTKKKEKFLFLPIKSAHLILYIAIIGFVIYSAFTLVNISMEKSEKEKYLRELEGQINIQEIRNDDLGNIYNYEGDELLEYAEEIAREELDYIKKGERIFINVSGD